MSNDRSAATSDIPGPRPLDPGSSARHDHRYQQRGVSAGKAEVHAAIANQSAGLFPGAFCKLVADELTGSADHALLLHADTAGSKAALAYLAWREGAPVSVFSGIAQDALVMNLDDCACVGSLGPFLVSNTIGRNAKRVPGEVISAIVAGYQAVCDQMAAEGIAIRMCGGETADVGDLVRTVDVGCTVAARMTRSEVIDAARMAPGDIIVGFASTGQARWESTPNAGIGSNGLTSARHELLGGYRDRYPETWAPEIDPTLAYCGKHRLEESLPGDDRFTIGSALLSPTRTYLPLIRDLLAAIPREDLHGLIHCSGGGQAKLVKFGRPGAAHGNRYVKDTLFPLPPLFAAIQASTGLPWAEVYSVYNCGHRLEAIVPAHRVEACLAAAKSCAIAAQVVGRVEENHGPGNVVELSTEHGMYLYR